MKKLILLFVGACTLLFCSYVKKDGVSNLMVELNNVEQKESALLIFGLVLDSQGTIRYKRGEQIKQDFSFDTPKIGMVAINMAILKYFMIEPGSNVKMIADGKTGDVKFEGPNSEDQEILNEFMEAIKEVSPLKNPKLFKLTYQEYESKLESISSKIEDLKSKANSEFLKGIITQAAAYEIGYAKQYYYNFYNSIELRDRMSKVFKDVELSDQVVPSSFVTWENLDINSPYLAAYTDDIEELFVSIYYSRSAIKNNGQTDHITLYNAILDDVKNENTLEDFAYQLFLKYGNIDTPEWEKLCERINAIVKDPARLDEMEKLMEKRKERKLKLANLKNLEVPDFELKDIDGNIHKIADYKGEFVYLDMWATWCGPCKMEIPHLIKKEEKYKNSNIVFISIAFDKDPEKWKDFLHKNKSGGHQLIAEGANNEKFMDHYLVRGFPTFILLGKDGRILIHDFVRPSDENFDILLEKAMEENK